MKIIGISEGGFCSVVFCHNNQLVSQQSNANFYQIIKHFEQLTGKGVILNTSFNLHGYPIVCGAIDACEVLVASALEYLVIED